MEGKTCCVTGHRDLPQKEIGRVKAALRREIDCAVADGFTRFMSGFADGVDLYFAEFVLEKKKTNPALELIAVIPYQKRLDNLMEKGRTYEMLESLSFLTAMHPQEAVTPGRMRCIGQISKVDPGRVHGGPTRRSHFNKDLWQRKKQRTSSWIYGKKRRGGEEACRKK